MNLLVTQRHRLTAVKPVMLVVFTVLLTILVSNSNVFAGGGPNVSGAKLYIKQNDLDNAIKVLEKEINEVNPNNEDAWYLLGYIYARRSNYDNMLKCFNKAVELKPEFHKKG